MTTVCHALNSGGGRFARLRRHRTTYRPTAMARLKAAVGRIDRSLTEHRSANFSSLKAGIHLQQRRLTEVECVTRGQGQDHQSSKCPLHKIRPDRGSERSCRHPEVGPWKNTLPASTCQSVRRRPIPHWHCCAYLPHSRIIRDEPKRAAMMFPNALRATRKLSPRTAALSPNTALKYRVATVVPELTRSYLDTAAFRWSETHS